MLSLILGDIWQFFTANLFTEKVPEGRGETFSEEEIVCNT